MPRVKFNGPILADEYAPPARPESRGRGRIVDGTGTLIRRVVFLDAEGFVGRMVGPADAVQYTAASGRPVVVWEPCRFRWEDPAGRLIMETK